MGHFHCPNPVQPPHTPSGKYREEGCGVPGRQGAPRVKGLGPLLLSQSCLGNSGGLATGRRSGAGHQDPGHALLSDPGQAQLSLSVSHLCPEGQHPHTTPASLGLPWDDRPRPWACNRLRLCREKCVNGLAVEMGPSKRTGTKEVCHNCLPSRHRGLEMATSGDSCSRASCVQSWPSSHTTTTSSSLCFH